MSEPQETPPLERPRSAVNFGLCLAALALALALTWILAPARLPAVVADHLPYTPIIPCLGVVLVIALGERLFPGLRARTSGGLSRAPLRPADGGRVATRLLGFAVTLGLVALAYWLFPEYHGSFYAPFWRFLRTIAPLLVVVPVYFLWTERRLIDPDEEYLAFGRLCLGRARMADMPLIRRHLLGWLVKAFFLPLMTVYLLGDLDTMYTQIREWQAGFMPAYKFLFNAFYIIDLLFCVVGYSAAARLFDSEIRSAEPTIAGWVAALICYQPFLSVIGKFYLQYDDSIYWDNWLASIPPLQMAWGIAVLVLSLIYALCTVAFGLRFSNLTHRGIITSGPYRWSKHPAYLSKNLSWWLMSVPFVSAEGVGAAIRNCALLALLNAVYYARARTEERHLSRDPGYVAYALWMNEHGLLKGLTRWLPFLRYRPPATSPTPAPGGTAIESSTARKSKSGRSGGSSRGA